MESQKGWVIYSRSHSWLEGNHRAPQSSHKAVSWAASPGLECPFATREFRQLNPRGHKGWSSAFHNSFPGCRQGCSSQKRNVSSVVFLFPTPSGLGCFCSPKLTKVILQGKKNGQLASFLFSSVHFLERVPWPSLIRVGVGQFPTQGTMTQAKPKARSA